MKPDELDEFLRDRISGLDQLPPPGTGWSSHTGWQALQRQLQPAVRKQPPWWAYAAASVALVLLGLLAGLHLRVPEPGREVGTAAIPFEAGSSVNTRPETVYAADQAPATETADPATPTQPKVSKRAALEIAGDAPPSRQAGIARGGAARVKVLGLQQPSPPPFAADPAPDKALAGTGGIWQVLGPTALLNAPKPVDPAAENLVADAAGAEKIKITVVIGQRADVKDREEVAEIILPAHRRKLKLKVQAPGTDAPETGFLAQDRPKDPGLTATFPLK